MSLCAQLVVGGTEQRDHDSCSCQPSQGTASQLSLLLTAEPELTGIPLPEKPSDMALPSDEHGCLQGAQCAVLPLACCLWASKVSETLCWIKILRRF